MVTQFNGEKITYKICFVLLREMQQFWVFHIRIYFKYNKKIKRSGVQWYIDIADLCLRIRELKAQI